MKRQRAEIEAALLNLDGDLASWHTAHVDRDVGITLAEADDERQQRVNGRFVRADQDTPAPQIAQLADRGFGFFGEADEALPVVLQHPPGFGERSVLRRAIEQLLPELELQP